MKATKKPVTVDFIEWKGNNLYEVLLFMGSKSEILRMSWENYVAMVKRVGLIIKTPEGQHVASIGDMIIKGVKGEHYPCKPDIFALTYDVHE